MEKNKSSISKAESYKAIGEYWDEHEITDESEPVEFDVDLQSQTFYYAIGAEISSKLNKVASERGVSGESLVNRWLQERLAQETSKR